MDVSYGIGKIKFVFNAQKDGPLIIKNNVSLFQINARNMMTKANVQIVIVDMILVEDSALYHQPIICSQEILDVKYGIGNR